MADLGEALAERGLEWAVIVTGQNVGANRDAMDPIEEGLGDRLAAVFDETTPAKRIETACDDVDLLGEVGADADYPAGAVIEVVEEIRDGLGLPTRLHDVRGADEERIHEVVAVVHAGPFVRNGPEGFDPPVEEVESAIRAAW